MDSTDLLNQFRLDVVDTNEPYLWSDTEVYSYIDSAQKQLCREVGGIPDATSPLTVLTVPVGTDWIAFSPLILKIRDAFNPVDGKKVEIENYENFRTMGIRFDGAPGIPRYMVIGMQDAMARLYPVAQLPQTIQLIVDRMPQVKIDDAGVPLEVHDRHFEGLGLWVRYRAYSKHDAETFNSPKAEKLKMEFETYCAQVRREKDRAKHKTRIIGYGGIEMNIERGPFNANRGDYGYF